MRRLLDRFFCLAPLLAAGAFFACGASPYVKLEEEHGQPVRNETSVQRYEFTLEGQSGSPELKIDSELEAGSIAWRFQDPNGKTVWEGSADGRLGVRRRFEPVAGTWSLELSFQQATGDYQVHWKARKR